MINENINSTTKTYVTTPVYQALSFSMEGTENAAKFCRPMERNLLK